MPKPKSIAAMSASAYLEHAHQLKRLLADHCTLQQRTIVQTASGSITPAQSLEAQKKLDALQEQIEKLSK